MKPSSYDELMALPIGPEVSINNGTATTREVVDTLFDDDDTKVWMDEYGNIWSLGRYADGSYFRSRRK